MQSWQDNPVTYGCMLRIALFGTAIVFIFVLVIGSLFSTGAVTFSTSSQIIFGGLGIIFTAAAWLFPSPFSPKTILTQVSRNKTEAEQAQEMLRKREENLLKEKGPHQETGTLIVWANEKQVGKMMYLLPRDAYLKCTSTSERDHHKLKVRAIITCEDFNGYPLYTALFRDLKKNHYNAWKDWGKDHPKSVALDISPPLIAEVRFSWVE